MRTISFVERLELDFSKDLGAGGLSATQTHSHSQAHHCQSQPLSLCQQAIALGDVDHDETNELVIGTVSGQLLIYKGSEEQPWKSYADLGMITCISIGNVCNRGKNYILVLSADGWCHIFHIQQSDEITTDDPILVHRQHLSANSKLIMIGDIDDDDEIEIVVGFSDRVVRTYKWYEHGGDRPGEIVLLRKWTLSAQIGSISLKGGCDSCSDIVVSQPGAAYVILKPDGQMEDHTSPASRSINKTVFTEVVGNVSTKHGQNYYALTTLDGTIMLMDNEGEKISDIKVDHQLFGLTKLDITGDGVEEVIVCSWDGQTYIVNSNKQIARFQFDEPTAAFLAGHYSVGDRNEACLIYVTFNGRIYIYHSIKLVHVQTFSLIEALENSQQVKQFMARIGMDECSREDKKKLYQWCLYGRKPKLCSD